MWTRRLFELAVTLAVVLGPGNAWADPPKDHATNDSLTAYRERFQLGMRAYRAGAVASAIADWEPVYLALGPRDGYRVAYDLGVAYLQIGDTALAAERLQAFLDEVTARRGAGEIVGAVVTREESDARARVAELVATRARIPSDASPELPVAPSPSEAPPSAGPAEATAATDPAPSPRTPESAPSAPSAPFAPAALTPFGQPARVEVRVRHPVSQPFVLASGALTAVAVAVAIPLGIHTFALRSRFVDEKTNTGSISEADRQNFDETRTAYDVALGSAVALGVLTSALTTWYFAGSSRGDAPPVEPVVAHERGGASVALRGRF